MPEGAISSSFWRRPCQLNNLSLFYAIIAGARVPGHNPWAYFSADTAQRSLQLNKIRLDAEKHRNPPNSSCAILLLSLQNQKAPAPLQKLPLSQTQISLSYFPPRLP